MRLVDARTGIEVVSRKECLALLADEEIGRLGVVDGYRPVILPVNYALAGEAIVFRTAPGTKVGAGRGAPVCFEVDRFDPGHPQRRERARQRAARRADPVLRSPRRRP